MKKEFLITAVVAGICAILCFSGPAMASVGKNDCTIKTSADNYNHPDDSIRYIEYLFNRSGSKQYCRSSIDFDISDAIKLKKPFILNGDNASNNNGTVYFGPDTAAERVTISLAGDASWEHTELKGVDLSALLDTASAVQSEPVEEEVSEDGEQASEESAATSGEDVKCAIYIKTEGVHLRNLVIIGNGVKSNGLCIDAANVTLENVVIKNFAGDAIRVSTNGVGLDFTGIVAVDQTSDVGMRVLGSQQTIQSPIDLPYTVDYSTAAYTGPYLDLLGAKNDVFIVSDSKAKIEKDSLCITQNTVAATYEVTGTIACENCTTTQQIKRLYVFRVPDAYSTSDLGVTPLAQLIGFHDAGDAGIVGTFTVPINVGPTGELAGKLFIIPETSPGIFASSSKAILMQHSTECIGTTTTTNGPVKPLGGTLQECLKMGALGINVSQLSIGMDSDGDTIPDVVEMRSFRNGHPANLVDSVTIDTSTSASQNATCGCDSTYLCWYKPDSDNDGIADNRDGVQFTNNGGTQNWTITLANTDLDSEPDVKDTESDNDSIPDGREDRSRVFNYSGIGKSKAYYFYFGGDASEATGPDGQRLTCYDPVAPNNDLKYNPDLGISYGLYYVDASGSLMLSPGTNMPMGYSVSAGAAPAGAQGVVSLECRNIRLKDDTNFNGEFNIEKGETNLRAANSDGTEENDNLDPCPTTTDVAGEPFCKLNCVDNEIWNGVSEEFVELDGNGRVTKIKKEELYAAIKENPAKAIQDKYCSDIDGDKLPDCLEWDGTMCSELGQAVASGKQFFDPYTKDTDGDGFVDGPKQSVLIAGAMVMAYEDKCPFTPGPQHDADVLTVATGLDTLSCGNGAYNIYSEQPLLAYFLDPDDDTIMSGFEDKDLSGGVPTLLKGKTPDIIAKTETDPLIADTDNDGLSDQYEIKTFYTNAADEDTDDDGLSDGEEVSFDGDPTSLSFALDKHFAENGLCWEETTTPATPTTPAVTTYDFGDTNPLDADSDADGISDSVEIQIKTNPNNADSDNDTLNDKQEDKDTDGVWPTTVGGVYNMSDDTIDTNPCATDTDGDGINDNKEIENGTCPGNPKTSCKYSEDYGKYGPDSDADGMPDKIETSPEWNTDPNDSDTDDDGLPDGCVIDNLGNELGELCEHFKTENWGVGIMTDKGESSPGEMPSGPNGTLAPGDCQNVGKDTVNLKAGFTDEGAASFCGIQIGIDCGSDSDGDGLPDYYEKVMFKTFPNNADSDGDGIGDGIETKWVVAEEVGGIGSGMFILKSQKGPEQFMAGSMTNPMDADTDKDTLVDGFSSATNFEDYNCNGRVDTDINGNPIELDPRTDNSDGDEWGDKDEFCWDGVCGASANMSRATSAQREGCGNIGGAGGETWGMTLMFAVMLAATRVAGAVLKRTKRSRRACSARR